MKVLTNELRQKIKNYKKSKKDISQIIEGYSIKGEDLSHSIITKFSRCNEDCRGVNLSGALIGEKEGEVVLVGSNFSNANFHRTKFLCKVNAKKMIAHNANFCKSVVVNVNYQQADLTGSSFCGIVTKIDTGFGKGAKFSKEVIQLLIDEWIKG